MQCNRALVPKPLLEVSYPQPISGSDDSMSLHVIRQRISENERKMSQDEEEIPKNEWKMTKCGRMRLSENFGEKGEF